MRNKLFFVCFYLFFTLTKTSYINLYCNFNINKNKQLYINNFCDPIEIADNVLNNNQKEEVIRSITNFLPMADSIGSIILNSNEYLINKIFDSQILDNNLKKSFILNLINVAINGDNYGGQFLLFYYDLVDKFL